MQSTFEPTYGIGDVERLTGVSQRMLRAWEGKHIPLPDRIACGDRSYRRYSTTEVKLIKKIKAYKEQGFTLKTASRKAREELGIKGGDLDA